MDAFCAPTSAVFPSAERATAFPNRANEPAVLVNGDAEPHDPPEYLNTAAYPVAVDAFCAPTSAVFPSAESATENPNRPLAPAVLVNGEAEPHDPPEYLKTAAYPSPLPALFAPTSAVFPSAESATENPNCPLAPAVLVNGEAEPHDPPEYL